MRLWHGTSSKYIEQIMRDGLNPECNCYDHICLTSDKDTATHFGQEMAQWEKADFVLLSVEMPELDQAGLCHEMGWIGNSLEEDEGDACLKRPALDMLDRYKVIGFNQVITPDLITRH